MPAPYSGSCLCGAVRLAISAEPAAVLSCFCQHCIKGAGGSHQLIAKFAEPDVQLTVAENAIGEYTFTDTSSGSPKLKAFCRTCGCPLWTVPSSAKGKFLLIRTALLDDGLSIKPQNEIFVKNRPVWMGASEGVTQWEGMRK